MTRAVLGFARIDAPLALAALEGSPWIGLGRDDIEGEVFLAQLRNTAAVAFLIPLNQAGGHDVERLARGGRLTALAVVTERENGLFGVSGVRLHALSGTGTAWIDDVPASSLPPALQDAARRVLVARASLFVAGPPLPVPPSARPQGHGPVLEISIAGAITDGRYAELPDRIRAARGRTIDLDVDSEGGDVATAMRVYSALAAHDRRVDVRMRRAASAAALIAMAGDLRSIDDDGFVLLHRASSNVTNGRSDFLRAQANRLDGFGEELARIVAAASAQPLDVARAWVGGETVFRAGPAVRNGLAHVVAPKGSARRYVDPWLVGRFYDAGDAVEWRGKRFVATERTPASPGREPDRATAWVPATWVPGR